MKYLFPFYFVFLAVSCGRADPPSALGPVPSPRQLAWHPLEYYGFIHFNMNTFTDREWGTGGEEPSRFNPTDLDTRQWARIASEAGMKALILTAKHHDGFCLWPTKTTEHSVRNSPWRDGMGDVVGDLAEACREYGLKFGVYLSPWDRNNSAYGTPEYVALFHEQLRELLSEYGPVSEVWFDGANGGHGWYGGADETRKIDNKTYYEWDKAIAIVRELQPDAVIFSDGGPDIRWVGNESGWADTTNWSIMRRDEIYPGWPRYVELRSGHEDGTHWLPAEADVSIRPGWYYHPSEDHRVKNLEQLLDIYYKSVGRNAALLLNIPVDNRGRVHETDSARLMQLRGQLQEDFRADLATGALASADAVRGRGFAPANVLDADPETYWSVPDDTVQGSLVLDFGRPTRLNRILLQEYIPLGQRIRGFAIEIMGPGGWETLEEQTTVGYKRILRTREVTTPKLRIRILDAKGPVCLSRVSVYLAPNLLTLPEIRRDREGGVTLRVPDPEVAVYYTLDGTRPDTLARQYSGRFPLPDGGVVNALARDPETGRTSSVVTAVFDLAKETWTAGAAAAGDSTVVRAFDDDPSTFWATPENASGPRELVIDLGASTGLKGFTYWPMQERWSFGHITDYSFSVSPDGRSWREVARGEFSNIANHPVEQRVLFDEIPARYIKLKALKVHGDDPRAAFGEIGVITN